MPSTTTTTSCPDNDDTDGLTQPTIVNDDTTPPDYSAATPKSEYLHPKSDSAFNRFYLRLFLNQALADAGDEDLVDVMELMMNKRTVAEAARELGRPRMTVHDQHQKGLAIMKKHLEANPELLELYNLDD
jgi:hypothetical protein